MSPKDPLPVGRTYGRDTVMRNLRLFNSSEGIERQIREGEVTKIYDDFSGVIYNACFLYDTRDGEIFSCGFELNSKLIKPFQTGVIGKGWLELTEKCGKPRIRKFGGFDRKLRLLGGRDGDNPFVVSADSDPETQLNMVTTNYAKNNILETILAFNYSQKKYYSRRRQI